jgi:hypothetical protein
MLLLHYSSQNISVYCVLNLRVWSTNFERSASNKKCFLTQFPMPELIKIGMPPRDFDITLWSCYGIFVIIKHLSEMPTFGTKSVWNSIHYCKKINQKANYGQINVLKFTSFINIKELVRFSLYWSWSNSRYNSGTIFNKFFCVPLEIVLHATCGARTTTRNCSTTRYAYRARHRVFTHIYTLGGRRRVRVWSPPSGEICNYIDWTVLVVPLSPTECVQRSFDFIEGIVPDGSINKIADLVWQMCTVSVHTPRCNCVSV